MSYVSKPRAGISSNVLELPIDVKGEVSFPKDSVKTVLGEGKLKSSLFVIEL